jgi:hypothetical protein
MTATEAPALIAAGPDPGPALSRWRALGLLRRRPTRNPSPRRSKAPLRAVVMTRTSPTRTSACWPRPASERSPRSDSRTASAGARAMRHRATAGRETRSTTSTSVVCPAPIRGYPSAESVRAPDPGVS